VDNLTIATGSIHLFGDLTSPFLRRVVETSLRSSLKKFVKNSSSELRDQLRFELPEEEDFRFPLKFANPVYGEEGGGNYFLWFRAYAAPGIILAFVYTTAMAYTIFSYREETIGNSLERIYSTGLRSYQVFVAQFIIRFIPLAILSLLLLASSIFVLGLPCRGSFFMALLILFFVSISAMLNGLISGLIHRNVLICFYVIITIFVTSMVLNGILSPTLTLPYYVTWFAKYLPFHHPLEPLRSVLLREGAPALLIRPAFLVSFLWSAIFFAVIFAIFAWRRRN